MPVPVRLHGGLCPARSAAADPVGPANDAAISDSCDWADQIVAAWGTHGAHLARGPHVARLLLGLRRGWKDGQGRALSAPAPLPEPSGPFLDFPARPGAAHLALSGRSWQRAILQKQARSAVAAGQIVTVFRFSPTALYHRMRFHPDGFWEQTGGQFGRSDRAEPLVQARTLAGRVAQEKALFAELRRF